MSGRACRSGGLLIPPVLVLCAWLPAAAGVQLNEPAAVLVHPLVLNESAEDGQPRVETLLTVTNAAARATRPGILFIGEEGCEACAIPDVPLLPPGRSLTLAVTREAGGALTRVRGLAGDPEGTCPGANGFVMVFWRDGDVPGGENGLLGSALIVDHDEGTTLSMPALVSQATASDADLRFEFGLGDYVGWPRVLAASIFAPGPGPRYDARLALYTLDFDSGTPPRTTCRIDAFDASATLSQAVFEFGCWTSVDVREIHPELGFPDLGAQGFDEHGWLKLDCDVDREGDGVVDHVGAVHGAITQWASAGTPLLERSSGGPAPATAVAWGRVLDQSVTTTLSVFTVEGCNGIDDDGDGMTDEGCDDDGDGVCDARLLAGSSAPVCSGGFGDCDDTDPAVIAAPGEITGLRMESGGVLTWESAAPVSGSGTTYQVLRGGLDGLPVGSSPEICLTPDPGNHTSLADPTPPPPAGGFYYLVRGVNGCGAGDYGGGRFARGSCPD